MEQQPQPGKIARWITLLVTNTTKLAGVGLALNEGFGHVNPRPILVGVAALMIAGAQGIETFAERLLGGGDRK